VDEHDDALDPLAFELRDEAVDRVRFVAERQAGDAGGGRDEGRSLERQPDEGDARVAVVTDRVRREQRVVGRGVDDIRAEEREARTIEAITVPAAIDRMTSAVLHAQELVGALVELVVADRRHGEAEQVHRFDRRLVVKRRGQQRRRTDQIAGGDDRRVRVGRRELREVSRQVLDTTRINEIDEGIGPRDDPTGRPARGLQVAVEVVEREELDRHGAAGVLGVGRGVREHPREAGLADELDVVEPLQRGKPAVVVGLGECVRAATERDDVRGRATAQLDVEVERVLAREVRQLEDRARIGGAIGDPGVGLAIDREVLLLSEDEDEVHPRRAIGANKIEVKASRMSSGRTARCMPSRTTTVRQLTDPCAGDSSRLPRDRYHVIPR